MTEPTQPGENQKGQDFSELAEMESPGLLREFWEFLCFNKKWWLAPIIVILLLMGALLVLSGTGAAPFIYALF